MQVQNKRLTDEERFLQYLVNAMKYKDLERIRLGNSISKRCTLFNITESHILGVVCTDYFLNLYDECDFNGIELVEEDDDTYYYLDFICSYRKDDDRDFAKEDFDTIKEYLNFIGYEILDMEYEYLYGVKYLERIFISKNR
jgi:hypothetical protein